MSRYSSMLPLVRRAKAGVVLVLACGGLALSAGDWPNWRGPDGNGSARGPAVTDWGKASVAWKAPLPGKGSSTPIVVKEQVFVTAPSDGQDTVLAFDLNGRPQWSTRLGPESAAKHRALGSSCNASPVSDGETVFAYFKSGALAAVDFQGKVRWQTNLVEQFGREELFWDAGSSPVVVGDLLIVPRLHGGDSMVVAFDKRTGALRWKQPREFEAPTENDNGYATPVVYREGNRDAFLLWGADTLTSHDARDGRLIWSAGGFNPERREYWPAIATPVVAGGLAVVPVGRDDRPGQASVHAVKLGGSGDVSTSHRAWSRDDVGVFVATPTVAGERVYLLRHRGEVAALDPSTGRTLWTEALPRASAPYYASPLVVDGVLYAAREDGVVFAARVGDRFELLGQKDLGERIVATPVPLGGRILLRGDQHLILVGGS